MPLARLRHNLDFLPSPVAEHPGLLIRDPYRYSDATLIVPPLLVPSLELFDGEHSELDLREYLVRATGDIQVGDVAERLTETLSGAGFLLNEQYEQLRQERHRLFAEAEIRAAAHSGGAYPDTNDALRSTLSKYLNGDPAPDSATELIGIAAPHVSPEGGWESYRSAYGALGPELAGRTFVILGTSHYGEPERFGLTRKRFATPYGDAITDSTLVNRLAERAAASVLMEDYCHAVEHSIEFQVIFLQHLFGPEIRILPILCGPFARSLYEGGKPEDIEGVRRFFGELGEIAEKERDRLCWVLGVDLAHMGRRYGDPFPALATNGHMSDVAGRDRQRIDRISKGDPAGYWELVQENHDDLKWCGSAPFYTFLKVCPGARGELRHYQQWNIDPESVVSFAAMTFQRQ